MLLLSHFLLRIGSSQLLMMWTALHPDLSKVTSSLGTPCPVYTPSTQFQAHLNPDSVSATPTPLLLVLNSWMRAHNLQPWVFQESRYPRCILAAHGCLPLLSSPGVMGSPEFTVSQYSGYSVCLLGGTGSPMPTSWTPESSMHQREIEAGGKSFRNGP